MGVPFTQRGEALPGKARLQAENAQFGASATDHDLIAAQIAARLGRRAR